MATFFVAGTESVEIAPAFFTQAGASSAVWTKLEYIAKDNPPQYTKNLDTRTTLGAEDKDGVVLTFYEDGEPNVLTVGVLQQKPEILQMLDNIVYTAETTEIIELAKRKVANLAIRLTTRSAKDNRKQIVVFPNTEVTYTTPGGGSKTSVQQLLLSAIIGTFKTTTGNLDAISIKKWVTEAGAAIDSSED
ncbi:hypothetical protein [Pedobacter faecalis]|uniref:hypothetical protein n=1 Tax=Pedobacter faecalis TaxID=3041495 RepID=UPI00254A0386|nr:hypothetical protein [Pedobacter sp. ELA7]